MKKLFLLLGFFVLLHKLGATQNACALRISLLTCAPGNEMYSTWGHTAIRVVDRAAGDDYVFNYGTFEFGPDFNEKFIKGNLFYSLSLDSFPDFVREYKQEKRSIWEQELKITCDEKEKLYHALQVNATGNNRYYLYNFLYDNCTTRARDIILNNMDSLIVFEPVLPRPVPTFRNLIHIYLDKEKEYWSKLGIDILLGARLDIKPTNLQAMFLPDYLLAGMNSATKRKDSLMAAPSVLLAVQPEIAAMPWVARPLPVFSFLFILVFILSVFANTSVSKALVVFDFMFFFTLGLSGILILFMWLATAHKECGNNFNLIWALPTHTAMAFFVQSRARFVRKYFGAVFCITGLALCGWFFLPQQMNPALIPVLLLVMLRSWRASKNVYAGK